MPDRVISLNEQHTDNVTTKKAICNILWSFLWVSTVRNDFGSRGHNYKPNLEQNQSKLVPEQQ